MLAQNNEHWGQIFYESYLPFYRIMELMQCGNSYSNFTGIPRLHGIAEKLGFINLEYFKQGSIPYEMLGEKTFVMEVTEDFMYLEFGKTLWRNDHYILFRKKDPINYEYVNNIPPTSGILNINQMNRAYGNNVIVIEINKNVQVDSNELIGQFKKRMEMFENAFYNIKNEINFTQLRDAIGILKVLVKRIEAFMQIMKIPLFDTEYYHFLYNYYVKVEYMRARGSEAIHLSHIVRDIEEKDKDYKKKLQSTLLSYK